MKARAPLCFAVRREEVDDECWSDLLSDVEAGLFYFDGFATIMTWAERERRMWPACERRL